MTGVRATAPRPAAAAALVSQRPRSILRSVQEQALHGGQLLTALSDAVVRILRDHAGKGPTMCKSHWAGEDTLVVLMSGGFTVAERTLYETGRGDAVRSSRQALDDALADRLKAHVEELTGRRVLAFMSTVHQDPDYAAELFVLEPRE
jgi:uncharacterized protein YbcI